MVAIARESLGADKDKSRQPFQASEDRPRSPFKRPEDRSVLPLWVNKDRKLGTPLDSKKCFYCEEIGHLRRSYNKFSFDEGVAQEQEALEKLLKGDD